MKMANLTKEDIRSVIETIKELYLEDMIPWICGYSGGKDSTAVVQLVWYRLAVPVSVENDAQRLSVIERLLQVFQEALLIAVLNAAAYFSVESQIVQSGNITFARQCVVHRASPRSLCRVGKLQPYTFPISSPSLRVTRTISALVAVPL